MNAPLSIHEIEKLVEHEASDTSRGFDAGHVRVFESPESTDRGTIIIQIVARRPVSREDWTKSRARFSQAVRDLLLKHGDDRFPVIEVFAPEEWNSRND